MSSEQVRDFVAQVDELRRLQQVTKRPPNALERRNLEAQEARVDALLAVYREPDEPAIAGTPSSSTPSSSTS